MTQRTAQKGFTLAETLISVGIIGVIAAMMIPTIIVSSQDKNALIRVKGKTQSCVEAAARLEAINPNLQKPVGNDVLSLTNFSARKTNGTLITGGNACSNTYPCYIYPDGSVIMSNTTGTVSGDVFTYFNVDPDGEGPLAGVTVLYDHDAGRTTTYDSANLDGLSLTKPSGLTALGDPSYAAEWVNGSH